MLFRRRRPIFKRICRNLQRGRPADADLDLGRGGALPGAADGGYYFAGLRNAAEDPVDISPLCGVLRDCWDEELEIAARAKLRDFFLTRTAIEVMEPVQTWITREGDGLSQGDIYSLALSLATEAAETEVVKFGLALLEMFDTGRDQPAREMLLKTGLHEEFTLFCLFNIRDWPDGNAYIWQLAKNCHGWGRIFAVENLEALTPEIERWLLCYGWQNIVSPSYTALSCAIHGDLPGFLRRAGGSAEEMAGMNAVMTALLDETYCLGIGAYDDPFALIAAYLEKVALHPAEAFDGAAVRAVEVYLSEHAAGAAAGNACRRAGDLCAAILSAHL
ncbi:MAG: hypothetical protein LBK56_11790 [Gracilibacteraceae bacterium]|nr:hypothetical protein [Gracilibacteraceae bacterium]